MLVTDRRGTGRSPRSASASVRISLARPSVLSHNFTAISEAGISLFKKREERREGGGREGKNEKKKEKSRKGRKEITFFSEGNERALSAAARGEAGKTDFFVRSTTTKFH